MAKVIIKVDGSGEKSKKKAIEMVSKNEEVQSFEVDEENKQLKVYGDMDPVRLVMKMRKQFPTADIVSMKIETPTVDKALPPEPCQPYRHPYPEPSAPPYWGDNSYYPPQSYPANGTPYHPYPSNWGQPWLPSGGYYGYYPQ